MPQPRRPTPVEAPKRRERVWPTMEAQPRHMRANWGRMRPCTSPGTTDGRTKQRSRSAHLPPAQPRTRWRAGTMRESAEVGASGPSSQRQLQKRIYSAGRRVDALMLRTVKLAHSGSKSVHLRCRGGFVACAGGAQKSRSGLKTRESACFGFQLTQQIRRRIMTWADKNRALWT